MMKCLRMGDTIEIGEYSGETVRDCIKKYGRKSILKIMKYYYLEEKILKEYHYRSLDSHKDSPEENGQDWIQELLDSPFTGGESFVTTTTQDEETLDLYQEYENDLDCYDNPVSYDPEDDDEFGGNGNSYKPWIYGR